MAKNTQLAIFLFFWSLHFTGSIRSKRDKIKSKANFVRLWIIYVFSQVPQRCFQRQHLRNCGLCVVYVLNGGVLLLVSYWEGGGGGGERGNMKNTHCDFLEMWSAVLKDSMVSS